MISPPEHRVEHRHAARAADAPVTAVASRASRRKMNRNARQQDATAVDDSNTAPPRATGRARMRGEKLVDAFHFPAEGAAREALSRDRLDGSG